MARKTTAEKTSAKNLLAKSILGESTKATPQQVIERSIFEERGKKAIYPSLPAKYNPLTGKVVLLDLEEHNRKCMELLEKGIIPIMEGYIYVDELAYKTLQSKNLIDPNLGSFDSQSIKKVTQVGFSFVEKTEGEVINDLRKNLDFVKALKVAKTKTYKKILNKSINSDSMDDLIEFISSTPFKTGRPTDIYLYYTPQNNFVPYFDSKLVIYSVKSENAKENINITNFSILHDEDVYYSDEFEALSQVSYNIVDPQAAGHLKAIKSSEVEDLLEISKDLLIDPSFIKQAGSNAEDIMKRLEIFIELIEEDLKELKDIDRLLASPAAYFHKNLDVTFSNLVAGANQLGQGVYFSVVTEKGLLETTKAPAYIDMLCQIEGISTPESSLINSAFKGSRTGIIIARIKNAWERAAHEFGKRVLQEEANKGIVRESSHSLLQAVLIKTLGEIFGVNTKNKINLTTKKSIINEVKNLYKKSKSINPLAFRGKKVKFKSIKRRAVSRKNRSNFTAKSRTENILPIINAEIKRYVLEQMSYPSLVNRSGRFASSVRVLSAQEDAAVRYTYQKSPYQVFSRTRGKPPWNDRDERDPAEIIDKAIKKLGMERFRKVFRTEEV